MTVLKKSLLVFVILCLTWREAVGFPSEIRIENEQEGPTENLPNYRLLCEEDGNYPIGNCSNQYYICIDGEMYPETCPGNGIFDPISLQCKAPENVPSCGITRIDNEKDRKPNHRAICDVDGHYPIGSCSNQYYICIDGEFYPESCPGGGVFDPVSLQCKAPENVPACGITTSTVSTSTTTLESGGSTSVSTESTPDGGGGTSTVSSTVTESISTVGRSTTTVSTTTESGGSLTCPAENGIFGLGDCLNIYYVCTNNVPEIRVCPGDFVFDPRDSQCKSREDAGCNSTPPPTSSTGRTSPTQPTVTTTSSPPTESTSSSTVTVTTTRPVSTTEYIFSCPDNNVGFYPLTPTACSNSYYVCVDGVFYEQQCPFVNIFDATISACTDPELAACNNQPLYFPRFAKDLPNDGGLSQESKAESTKNALYPVSSTGCSSFYYERKDGINLLQQCPFPNIFDATLKACTAPDAASCNTKALNSGLQKDAPNEDVVTSLRNIANKIIGKITNTFSL